MLFARAIAQVKKHPLIQGIFIHNEARNREGFLEVSLVFNCIVGQMYLYKGGWNIGPIPVDSFDCTAELRNFLCIDRMDCYIIYK